MRLLILVLGILFLHTSCLEIVETITVKKDKSGSVSYRVKTTGTGSLLDNFSAFIDNSFEDQLRKEAEKLVYTLKQQEGIHHVDYRLGKFSGDFYVSFDFESPKYFNEALYKVGGYKKNCFTPGYLKIKCHSFKKRNITPWLNRYLKKEGIEIDNSIITDMLFVSGNIILPDNVKRIKPRKLEVTEEENTVQYRISFTDIIENNKSTGIKVRY